MKKYFDEELGWGDVTLETEHYLVIRLDADPWSYVQIPKMES